MAKWIISDNHYGHKMLVLPETGVSKLPLRRFRDVEEMNKYLTRRWLKVVKPTDTVYCLGDFSFQKQEEIETLLLSLPGQKILIHGNHDRSCDRMVDLGFDMACQAMVVPVCGHLVLLNHRPLAKLPNYEDPEYPDGIELVIHGHIHETTAADRMEANKRHGNNDELIHIPSFNVNVSAEVIKYTPVSLDALVSKELERLKSIPVPA